MEITGELSVTFKVRNTFDLQRIQEFVREFEGQAPVIADTIAETWRHYSKGQKSQKSQGETFQKLIDLLKSTFPKGFSMTEAEDLVESKLGWERTEVAPRVGWAKRKGILLKQGHGYFWRGLVEKGVAKRIEAESPDMDIANAATPVAIVQG